MELDHLKNILTMEEEIKENETPKNEGEETPETLTENETPKNEPIISDEDLAELRKKAELAENYKVRAEKAEQKIKGFKEKQDKTEKPESDELSQKDLIAVMKSGIDTQDVDDVVRYAKFNQMSVEDAIKDKVMTAILKERVEERKSAEAMNIKGSSRQTPKVKGEDILSKTRLGQLPENEDEIRESVKAYLFKKK